MVWQQKGPADRPQGLCRFDKCNDSIQLPRQLFAANRGEVEADLYPDGHAVEVYGQLAAAVPAERPGGKLLRLRDETVPLMTAFNGRACWWKDSRVRAVVVVGFMCCCSVRCSVIVDRLRAAPIYDSRTSIIS
jgi:hypothetical protein